ncbi:MAG: hypothetical protein ACFFD2_11840 [Promethearchaeota archaeon]
MKKISDNKYQSENFELHQVYYKYLWLLGQFIQHSLFYLQGIRVPDPPELKMFYPDKEPAELINIHREIYGCKFNWKTGDLIVSYRNNQFNISLEAKKIIANNVSNKLVDLLSFDDNAFDFNSACDKAVKNIIDSITNGQKKPL